MAAPGPPGRGAAATDMDQGSPLVALTLAALSLPAFAATQPVESTLSMGVANYREADVPRHRLAGGDARRYDVDIRQFRLLAPAGRDWSFGLEVSRETMSGASPWASVVDAGGEPALIMSGATIHDSRTETSLSATRYGEDHSVTLAVTQSQEDDYRAIAPALSGEWAFNDDLTTLSLGLSSSSDILEPSDAAVFGRVTREKRRSRSAAIGVSQVLDRMAAVYAGVSATRHEGFLSDPYKLRDVRPDARLEWTFSLRYRQFLPAPHAALHLDYRYFDDDWGIVSHTLHASWYQNVGPVFQVVPNLRYYTQSAADFYRSSDDFGLPLDVDQSSDFRLSAYGAFTFGLKGIVQQPGWTLTLSADRYISSEKYGLENAAEHPARLAFDLLSAVLDVKF